MHHTTEDSRSLRLMTLVDEFSRHCLVIKVERRLNSMNVIESLANEMLERGIPAHVRSENGVEMMANIVCDWLGRLGAKTPSIAGVSGFPCSRRGLRFTRTVERIDLRRG